MKKFLFIAIAFFAAVTISLTSCSKTPAEKAISIFEEATEQVEKTATTDTEKLGEIYTETHDKLEKLLEDTSDYEATEKEAKELRNAYRNFHDAFKEKGYYIPDYLDGFIR